MRIHQNQLPSGNDTVRGAGGVGLGGGERHRCCRGRPAGAGRGARCARRSGRVGRHRGLRRQRCRLVRGHRARCPGGARAPRHTGQCGWDWVRPEDRRGDSRGVASGHRCELDRDVPALPGRPDASARGPGVHRQHGLGGRVARHAVQRRLLRVQGRGDHAYQVHGVGTGPRRGPRQRGVPGLGRHAVLARLHAARRSRPGFALAVAVAEVAAAVAYLASDDAATITGTTLVIDGGATA
jgi:hypothetical protein